MRYMAIAGLIWCLMYFLFAIFISYYARFSSWKTAHPEIPMWIFFIFADAADYDLGLQSNPWVILKIIVAACCILLTFICIIIGLAYTGVAPNNSFFYFCAIVLFLYYCGNISETCKPYAVFALWNDDIPNPSASFLNEQKRIANALARQEIKKMELDTINSNPNYYEPITPAPANKVETPQQQEQEQEQNA